VTSGVVTRGRGENEQSCLLRCDILSFQELATVVASFRFGLIFGPEDRGGYISRKVSRDSAVGIATGYGLDDREVGIRVPVGSRIITSPCCPDRLWGPLNLLYNGYRELFPRR
jgi:hypothetical protein